MGRIGETVNRAGIALALSGAAGSLAFGIWNGAQSVDGFLDLNRYGNLAEAHSAIGDTERAAKFEDKATAEGNEFAIDLTKSLGGIAGTIILLAAADGIHGAMHRKRQAEV